MATVNTICNKMKSWIGIKEGPQADRVIISPWNKKTGCHATSTKNPWCAITVSSCLLQCKASGYSLSATCSNQKKYYKNNNRFYAAGTKPKRGDVLFITGHEAIVTCVRSNGTGAYISGNSANAVRLGEFNWKTNKCGKKAIQGYGRPKYTAK